MTEASNRTAFDPLVAGWGELQQGRGSAARALFQQALAGDESPEAWEVVVARRAGAA